MSKRIQALATADWRGGLNLASDEFLLEDNESPDLLNVDVDPRGGFRQRKGITKFGDPTTNQLLTMWTFQTVDGVQQVMASTPAQILYGTGGVWGVAGNRLGPAHATTFKGRCYIQTGQELVARWAGTVGTFINLGENWNENLESPTPFGSVGNMPRAKLITNHLSTVFIANTTEGGVNHPNRLRFSHPNFPEDWRSFDYIDIEPGDGDQITALVPFQGMLLVFKRRAIYALHGDGPETFRIEAITTEIGTLSQEATVATDEGVYFFAWPEGVFLFGNNGPVWKFDRIEPALRDGRIPHAYHDRIQLGWGNRRLWVSVPWQESDVRNRVFVLDSSLTKNGSWVAYDLKVGPFVEWAPPGGDALFLAYGVGRNQVLRLDQEADADFYSTTPTPIISRYRTKWYDLDAPWLKKQWKRPELVLAGGSSAEIYVKVFHDWDATSVKREFRINVLADDESIEGTWDGASTFWDESTWARGEASGGPNVLERGSPLGTSRSVSLEFNGPTTPTFWGVGNMSLKYIIKRPRS